ncbi:MULTISPECIES: sn-glycerol-3-phosphate ABC transporter substrate-binding protein UgpB [unclassified Halomonas]|uniref:sn-glycerol-3-phosphate ABC transporter substrate-binding protein UgpB n=1 Tax=unclassified Halomonas TaxID=2609666 RepID=UPI00209D8B56|nr:MULTISPECIES: sn-glycerol-3-phosphate ABC transporter substrate-binding protein UgpB [unclassified Halomonas]MCP1314661.1 sn-glycerol-3-phosphate ABC transporter substrate-binding protein UgpB [Halomonas sp. 707D7]MCP1326743.1 sn-glycerol-3-phosphate ABC transporter substrate-binding protein UgpB [Halomonas sp. 707D4]
MSRFTLRALSVGIAAATLSVSAQAATDITWWHSMGGELGERLVGLAEEFNATQDEYRVVPSYRGEYEQTMVNTIAAFRAGEQPHIVQIYEVGTGTMMAARGAIYPVFELMEEHGNTFDPNDYLPVVTGYYTDTDGNMLSMPFNSSTPILYYNKDAFEAAGLDPQTPPTTWAQMGEMGQQIVDEGAAQCGFTMAYAANWIGLENFSALHNLPIGTQENGFGGLDTEFDFNGEMQARFWDQLKEWSDSGVYSYGGPASGPDAAPSFYAGDCAMYMNSSASRADVLANADFEVGFGMLPYYDDVDGAPQNSIIGGATLWVLAGHEEDEYAGVAEFLEFLSLPEVQAEWHQETGYLPITTAAYELSQEQGYYDENPGADIAIEQINLNEPTENSKGLRFGNYPQVRMILDEEFQAVLAGSKDGQQALDDAARRGNQILRDFESANN